MLNKYTKHIEGLVTDVKMDLLRKIAKDYNLDMVELKEKYVECKKQKKKKREKKTSGYVMFISDVGINQKIIEEHGELSSAELFRIRGKMWSDLSSEEKNKWKNFAKEHDDTKKNSVINEEDFNLT